MGSTRTRDPIEFRLLGSFELVSGGHELAIGSGQQRALLAILVLRLNRVVSRDELVEELWGDAAPPSAATSLHSLVSRLRRTLAEHAGGAGDVVLDTRDPGYMLRGDPRRVDAHRFGELAAEARECLLRGNAEAAIQSLRVAIGLWRGRPLLDLAAAGLVRLEAERLEEARLAVLEDLADAELACGHPHEAVALLEPHVAAHPFRERAWGQLMLSLYRLGRQADALAAYRRVRAVVVEELGVEPTPALRRLEQQILHQSPELDGSVPVGQVGTQIPMSPPTAYDTIAFLFTDIEASSRRWEGNREAMARDLARHDDVLRAAIEGAGGEMFAHSGDGLAAAFPTASAALAAAVEGQRALRDELWSGSGGLPVRMAIHAGSVERRDGNYFGPTMNRAARLLGTAHGGQVLCSQAAGDLARDDALLGVRLVDLGEHALTDLSRPERVFQLIAPGLPSSFPPLRSASARGANLPVPLTPLTGRAAELLECAGCWTGPVCSR